MSKPLVIRGCYPAISVPFDANYQIVESEFRTLIRTIDRPGVAGAVVNGHAGELPSINATERVRLVRIAREELSRTRIVVAGIDGPTVETATEQLKAARDAGADAALVVPAPFDRGPGGSLTRGPAVTLRYFTAIAKVGLPLVLFYRYEGPRGASYTMETLVRLSEIHEVVGVKISTFDTQVHQEGVEVLAGRLPILSAGDAPALFGSMLLGSDGIISGAVQLCPEAWGRYTDYVVAGEVREARDVFVRHLLPILTHIYSGRFETTSSANARTKEALVQLGILSNSRVRPPELDVTELDRQHVRIGLERAHLIADPVRA